jgi:RNA polymerase sigma factor (sigma-70 family)
MDEYLEDFERLVKYVFHLTNNWYDSEDIAQEAMLRFSEKSEARSMALLYHIARNLAGRAVHRRSYLPSADTEFEEIVEHDESSVVPVDVEQALSSLDKIDRLILTVAIMDGKGYKEAAKTTGLAYDATRQRGSRALKFLKGEFQQAL